MPGRQPISTQEQQSLSEDCDSCNTTTRSISSSANRVLPSPFADGETQAPPSSHAEQPWSPALEAVLEKPASTLPQWFAGCGFTFAIILGAWAWLGHFDEVIHAQGKLVPLGKTHKVHPLEAGKLISLKVEEGQQVQKGDLLAVLASEQAQAEANRLQHQIQLKQQQLSQHQSLLDTVRREGQTRHFIAETSQQTQQVEREKVQLEIQTLQGVLERDRQGLARYEERLQRLAPLVASGALAKERLFQVEQEIHQQQTALFQTEASLDQAQARLRQFQTIQRQKEQETQRISLETEQQLNQLTQKTLQLQTQLSDAASQLQQTQRQLQDYQLYAPTSGIVASLNVQNPGELLPAGQTVLEIRQQDDPLILEVDVASRDAGFLKAGTSAQLRFDAYPYQKFGVIPGEVIFISPDSYQDSYLGTVYRVQIATEQDSLFTDSKEIPLQAGQTATADLVIRRRRVADLILDPLRKLRVSTLSDDEKGE